MAGCKWQNPQYHFGSIIEKTACKLINKNEQEDAGAVKISAYMGYFIKD
tara:strand:- start:42796 stop:42942 length:147 start_codon:yes stop_codon:yes gene_type:complete